VGIVLVCGEPQPALNDNFLRSIPFSYYYLIVSQNTLAIYSNVIAKNGGYYSDLSKNLSSNSTFIHYNATFYSNAEGYVLSIHKFLYTRLQHDRFILYTQKPDIAFYYTSVLYNNAGFQSVFGASGTKSI